MMLNEKGPGASQHRGLLISAMSKPLLRTFHPVGKDVQR